MSNKIEDLLKEYRKNDEIVDETLNQIKDLIFNKNFNHLQKNSLSEGILAILNDKKFDHTGYRYIEHGVDSCINADILEIIPTLEKMYDYLLSEKYIESDNNWYTYGRGDRECCVIPGFEGKKIFYLQIKMLDL